MDKQDVAKYEIFAHRLFNILEEGRLAVQQVSGSAVVSEGGETMCAFYTPQGDAFMTAAGILLHITGASRFVKRTIELYQNNPGIYDGDQFLWNDPYTGGMHTQDNIMIKPIFYDDELVAWVSSFMHTPETGAIDAGGTCPRATEIYHEGLRTFGLKLVDKGEFRPEIFNMVTLNTRLPDLVGLDHKAKIAANNVCSRLFLQMVHRFGKDFICQASEKLIKDSDKMARFRLQNLPGGRWASQLVGDNDGLDQKPFRVYCTMTKKGDTLTFDFTGTASQNPGSLNAAFPATEGRLFATLVYHLFWGLPWNSGTVRCVNIIAPEGTVANCRYPSAVSNAAIGVVGLLGETAHECIAKMLYAAAENYHEDVVASFSGAGQHGFWHGRNKQGQNFVVAPLDQFANGLGASPCRDGVDTGGKMITPAASIIDVEMFELNYPLLYLFRRHATDCFGYGKYRGGMSGEAAYMAYGTSKAEMGGYGCGLQTAVSFGLFGGYPAPPSETFAVTGIDLLSYLRSGLVPADGEELARLAVARNGSYVPFKANQPAFPVREGDVQFNRWLAGGGYGDPLERCPRAILRDIREGALTRQVAERIFGVSFLDKDESQTAPTGERIEIDWEKTGVRRDQFRRQRLENGASPPPKKLSGLNFAVEAMAQPVRKRVHEYLDIVYLPGGPVTLCRKCGTVLGSAWENYKSYSAFKNLQPENYLPKRAGQELAEYREFYCPGCGTLLQVDTMLPGDPEPIWDIKLDLDDLPAVHRISNE